MYAYIARSAFLLRKGHKKEYLLLSFIRGYVYVCEHVTSTFRTPNSANSCNIFFYSLVQEITQKSSCC